MIILSYLLTGILAGLLSGLLGVGGGIVIVPALVEIFRWQHFSSHYLMQMATATSLGTMIMTSMMVTWWHHKRKGVRWEFLPYLIPGMVLGVLFGVWGGKHLPTHMISIAFAIFVMILGIKILWQAKQISLPQQQLPIYVFFFATLSIGALSGILGIGGGLLVVPLLLWYGLGERMAQVSGTSTACVLPTSIIGALTAVVVGWSVPDLPPHSLGFVNWPAALILGVASLLGAPLGVYLVNILPSALTKRVFASLLIIIAIRMLFK